MYPFLTLWYKPVPQLVIAKARKSVFGNYVFNPNTRTHTISVNGDLNPFHFLVTLLHELAHFRVYLQCKGRAYMHGKEWKTCFRTLLEPFLQASIFPDGLADLLSRPADRLRASTCTDGALFRLLHAYDPPRCRETFSLLADLAIGTKFQLSDGKRFLLLNKKRTRYTVKAIPSERLYLFHASQSVIRL